MAFDCAPIGIEADTVVGDGEAELTVVLPDPHRDLGSFARMLAGVLHGLDTAEVHGGLELLVVAIDVDALDRGRQRGACGGGR